MYLYNFIYLFDCFKYVNWLRFAIQPFKRCALYLFSGPVASVLVSIFGCRKVAIFGAVMAAVSFFMCTWSPNVQVMILLYGLLGGKFLYKYFMPLGQQSNLSPFGAVD